MVDFAQAALGLGFSSKRLIYLYPRYLTRGNPKRILGLILQEVAALAEPDTLKSRSDTAQISKNILPWVCSITQGEHLTRCLQS